MSIYIVKRAEIWTQKVEIEASNEDDARRKVADGHGEIREDAQFADFAMNMTWDVEEEPS